MKKIFLVIALVFAFNSISAQTSAIKANPLGLAFGIVNAGFEFATTDTQSATISGIYYNISNITGYGVGAEYRFYFGDEALKGWHAGPSLGYLALEDNSDTSAGVFSLGAEAGHQWVWDSGFLVDVFGGLGYATGGDMLNGLNATSFSIGASIGYAW